MSSAWAVSANDLAFATPLSTPGASVRLRDQTIWLPVMINGHELPDYVEVHQPRADKATGLRIAQAQWQVMGLSAQVNEITDDGFVVLDALIDIAYRYDIASQRLYLIVPVSRFRSTTVSLDHEVHVPKADPFGVSAVLNYDAFVQVLDSDQQRTTASGLLQGRVATPRGNVYQSAIVRTQSPADRERVRRLETSYQYFDDKRLISYQVGDAISRGLNTRPSLRFAGVQVQRNFSLRPDLVTVPSPQFSGGATVPTTVDVLIDQAQRRTINVPAGPFTLNQLPVLTGPHQVQVIVRDALGRDQVTVLDLFSAPQLLAPGLLDFAAQAGVQRERFNSIDDGYENEPFFIGSLRYGLNRALTVASQLEGDERVQVATLGMTTVVADRATFGLTHSMSRVSTQRHHETTLQTDIYLSSRWFLQASLTMTDEDFRDLSSFDNTGTQSRQREQVSMSYGFDGGASLGLNYVAQTSTDNSQFESVFFTLTQPFWQKGNASLTLSQRLDDTSDTAFSFGLSWFFDTRISTSARHEYANRDSSQIVRAQLAVPQDSGFGWQLEAAQGQQQYQRATLQQRNRYSDLTAMFENNLSGQVGRLSASGSVAWLPGTTMATRRINDAFALVDLGYANVPVFSENRPIGITNNDGQLMLPNLNSYLKNKISIAANDLPFDVAIDNAATIVVPSRDAGVLVRFNTQREQASLVSLRYANGEFVAVGARVLLPSLAQRVVGHDGMLLLDPSTHGVALAVLTDTQRCVLNVPTTLTSDAQRATELEVICSE